ncbi:MAG: (Fe-S)-binding protein [Thermodesulfobacteriota bacterium]|nr:(Fe-S)-binding protein [Thermodesulfobacteriota bacterium]
MNALENIKKLEDDIGKCAKCGLCQVVCPIFLELGQESSVARGKIALVEALSEGKIKATSNFAEKIQCCLLCGRCVKNCPNSVRVDHIVFKSRTIIADIRGILPVKCFLLKVILRYQQLLNIGIKIVSTFQILLFKQTHLNNTHRSRLSIGLNRRRIVLPLSKKALRDEWPEFNLAHLSRGKVVLFIGCIINFILTRTGDAVIKVLLEYGIDVIIPKGQSCCGIVAMASGDETTFRKLAKKNLKLLSKLNADAIIVACATCKSTLQHKYLSLLFNEPSEFHDMAEKVAGKTYDICEYLINILRIRNLPQKTLKNPSKKTIVTYHDPCHPRRGQMGGSQERELINMIDYVTLKEMPMLGRCCGGGGSFNLSYYNLSVKIGEKRIADIEKTGADIVLTHCSGCHMQLIDILTQRSSSIQVKHPVDLYFEAIKTF